MMFDIVTDGKNPNVLALHYKNTRAVSRPEANQRNEIKKTMEGAEPNKVVIETENARLRRLLAAAVRENKNQATQLSGVSGLVRQLDQKRKETESLEAKCQRLEGTLVRAENRIAQ